METSKFIVTDGTHVVGTFRTLKRARYHLANANIRKLDGEWVPLREDGFYIEEVCTF